MLGAPMPSLEKHEGWGNRVVVSAGICPALCHFATVNVPEMNVFVHPPPRPLRQEADHAQSTVTCTGVPAESLPEAVPFIFTSD